MSGPAKTIAEGWALISKVIKMEEPRQVKRYLGCEHEFTQQLRVTLTQDWHGQSAILLILYGFVCSYKSWLQQLIQLVTSCISC